MTTSAQPTRDPISPTGSTVRGTIASAIGFAVATAVVSAAPAAAPFSPAIAAATAGAIIGLGNFARNVQHDKRSGFAAQLFASLFSRLG